ncbi:hypothetical protein EVAR_92265_1 [Eumeta japonica]|uniref:Uncharacterized protein n=1 Tax=Eumeta variegata TaxID=151549 RepID=A0A4C1TNM5_EUMVA|nr:hypothetical protein EVAR_92265_1 [Eumeta japonica]
MEAVLLRRIRTFLRVPRAPCRRRGESLKRAVRFYGVWASSLAYRTTRVNSLQVGPQNKEAQKVHSIRSGPSDDARAPPEE